MPVTLASGYWSAKSLWKRQLRGSSSECGPSLHCPYSWGTRFIVSQMALNNRVHQQGVSYLCRSLHQERPSRSVIS